MKLYITDGSPYARIARIVMLEKGLQDRVEVILAQTRAADSPYYRINPSGRVPYLVRDDRVGLEESALICEYLDHFEGRPAFDLPPGGEDRWQARRLEALARSMNEDVAALMITNPNTLGVFEQNITRIAEIMHAKGGLVYMDGANMNALVGIARPGDGCFEHRLECGRGRVMHHE